MRPIIKTTDYTTKNGVTITREYRKNKDGVITVEIWCRVTCRDIAHDLIICSSDDIKDATRESKQRAETLIRYYNELCEKERLS